MFVSSRTHRRHNAVNVAGRWDHPDMHIDFLWFNNCPNHAWIEDALRPSLHGDKQSTTWARDPVTAGRAASVDPSPRVVPPTGAATAVVAVAR